MVLVLPVAAEQHHADEARTGERVAHHGAIARLEDVQRQRHVRKEDDVGQRKDRNEARQFHGGRDAGRHYGPAGGMSIALGPLEQSERRWYQASMDARLPIIVGVGQITDRGDDLATKCEPLALAAEASQRALADAECTRLGARIDSVRVVNMLSGAAYEAPAGALGRRAWISRAANGSIRRSGATGRSGS